MARISSKGGVPCDIVATVPEALQKSSYIVEHEHPNGPEYQKVKTWDCRFRLMVNRSATKGAPRLNEHYEEV